MSTLIGSDLPLTGNTTHARLGASPDRLDSWKEIACYLKREVRTVQLWEKREGMPVHRHYHNRLGTVYAFRSEIEAWALRQIRKDEPPSTPIETMKDVSPAPFPARQVAIEIVHFEAPTKSQDRLVKYVVASIEAFTPSRVSIVPDAESSNRENDLSAIHTRRLRLCWKESPEVTRSMSGFEVILIDCSTESVLWSRSFAIGKFDSDLIEMIGEQVARCVWLTAIASSFRIPKTDRKSSDAREAYLKGRYFLSHRNESGLRQAAGWFRTAIDLDPRSGLAYSGLADSLSLMSFYEIEPSSETIPEARHAAIRAVELGPDLAEAHASLADIHFQFDRDWARAEQEFRRAIECNPGYAPAYQWYANLLAARGQHEAARAAVLHALDVDPVSVITQVWAGVTSHLAHQFEGAVQYFRNALELEPNFFCAYTYMALTLEQLGRYGEALEALERAIQITGGSSFITAMKAHTLAAAGDHNSASRILLKLDGSTKLRCVPSFDIAATYAALGECSRSVQWLRRACNDRHMRLFSLTQDPRFDNLRNRLEFRGVLDEIGLNRNRLAS